MRGKSAISYQAIQRQPFCLCGRSPRCDLTIIFTQRRENICCTRFSTALPDLSFSHFPSLLQSRHSGGRRPLQALSFQQRAAVHIRMSLPTSLYLTAGTTETPLFPQTHFFCQSSSRVGHVLRSAPHSFHPFPRIIRHDVAGETDEPQYAGLRY